MTPFKRDEAQSTDSTPETQARDAVAHGSGALTKRTVDRGDEEQPARPNQTVTVIPPDAPLVPSNQSDYDRGKDVLREFREMDAQPTDKPQTLTEKPTDVTPRLNHYQEGHGVVYWLFTIIFVIVATFVVVKKFLLTDKPALTKSQLFEDTSDRLRAATEKIQPVKSASSSDRLKATSEKVKPSPPKTARLTKKDDDKGKHFEIRI